MDTRKLKLPFSQDDVLVANAQTPQKTRKDQPKSVCFSVNRLSENNLISTTQ